MSESSSSGSQENAPSTSQAASGESVNNVHNSQPPLNTQLPPMTPQVNVNHSSHLPKLNLPAFSDNPLNWSTFWDSFKAAVHSTTTLGGVPFKCPKGGAEARKEYKLLFYCFSGTCGSKVPFYVGKLWFAGKFSQLNYIPINQFVGKTATRNSNSKYWEKY